MSEEEAPHFTCPRCRRTSYHPKDVENQYCGYCHTFFLYTEKRHNHGRRAYDPLYDPVKKVFKVMIIEKASNLLDRRMTPPSTG